MLVGLFITPMHVLESSYFEQLEFRSLFMNTLSNREISDEWVYRDHPLHYILLPNTKKNVRKYERLAIFLVKHPALIS